MFIYRRRSPGVANYIYATDHVVKPKRIQVRSSVATRPVGDFIDTDRTLRRHASASASSSTKLRQTADTRSRPLPRRPENRGQRMAVVRSGSRQAPDTVVKHHHFHSSEPPNHVASRDPTHTRAPSRPLTSAPCVRSAIYPASHHHAPLSVSPPRGTKKSIQYLPSQGLR